MRMTMGGHLTLAQIRAMRGDYAQAEEILATPVPPEMQKYREFYQLIVERMAGNPAKFDEGFSRFITAYGDQEPVRDDEAWLRFVSALDRHPGW